MYLATRDIEEVMAVYIKAWEKGLKTTYYLHMKPRHSAEQSTVAVNKAATIGKSGFGAAVARAGFGAAAKAEVEIKVEEPAAYKACPIDPQERAQCDSCQ